LSPNQLEANGNRLEVIYQRISAAQLEYCQKVEEKEGGWVFSEEVSVYYPGTVLRETAAKWTPAPGDSGSKVFWRQSRTECMGKFR
jgi:hypothetical protein